MPCAPASTARPIGDREQVLRALLLGLALLCAGCADRAEAPAFATAPNDAAPPAHTIVVLDAPDRIGDAVVGAHFDPATDAGWIDEGQHPETDCGYFSGGPLPAGVQMMVADGRIQRFELYDPDLPLAGPFGLRPGISQDAALAAMPASTASTPHEYGDANDVYLTWRDPQRGIGVRAEVVGETVESVFWGGADAIQLVESCS
ncbi:hypothetical protein LDO26_10050 [Luteimonas sp. BDR2-5]|uniref:hypothetical protein n=1 Tax=Proluteimonas luteida TaxID=2878685 RepID=UPI001E2B1B2B|nr:hypothetical protein [Luteimonas sp. BDR2-5]MCD9028547.1 hypothetical protein [Luteimonas sp. BDR2-5]